MRQCLPSTSVLPEVHYPPVRNATARLPQKYQLSNHAQISTFFGDAVPRSLPGGHPDRLTKIVGGGITDLISGISAIANSVTASRILTFNLTATGSTSRKVRRRRDLDGLEKVSVFQNVRPADRLKKKFVCQYRNWGTAEWLAQITSYNRGFELSSVTPKRYVAYMY
jgi:hypothetical protein